MSEAPKLYTNKPKKAQLRQFQGQQQKTQEFPSSSSTSSSMGPQSSAPPPQQPPKESFARRYKFVWPMLLAVNVAVGAYLFMRTKKKDTDVEEEVVTPVSTNAATTTLVPEKPLPFSTITEAVKSREPIPEDQQRELFKWLLEEKRKVKTKDPEEKKRIDEEKAILKQFIRAKSIPSI
ncbi:hypothetical protein I3760_02G140300 [Carya illinoinensis]|uniref:Transmembrane protein n=2 Tax=Carya illinoinensis TaxID=32201 RepID=A0A8T1RFL7_CARIL|nr:hypothetical protein I3760_02G140300 [Carya illinoinensis]KAG6665133.1 hypothetical protein CIPAW_02G140800 [Carya illinoinensis]